MLVRFKTLTIKLDGFSPCTIKVSLKRLSLTIFGDILVEHRYSSPFLNTKETVLPDYRAFLWNTI